MKLERIIKNFFKKVRNQSEIFDIDFDTLKRILKTSDNAILIDVRSPQEFYENRLESSINIPLYDIEKKADVILPDKYANIIVYCQSGTRSKKACKILKKLGYENLYNLIGGLDNV